MLKEQDVKRVEDNLDISFPDSYRIAKYQNRCLSTLFSTMKKLRVVPVYLTAIYGVVKLSILFVGIAVQDVSGVIRTLDFYCLNRKR